MLHLEKEPQPLYFYVDIGIQKGIVPDLCLFLHIELTGRRHITITVPERLIIDIKSDLEAQQTARFSEVDILVESRRVAKVEEGQRQHIGIAGLLQADIVQEREFPDIKVFVQLQTV